MQGAIKFHKVFPESNFVAVLPDKIDTLRQRLKSRGTETEEAVATRIGNASSECRRLTIQCDIFNYRVVNDNLEVAVNTLSLLVQGLYPEELTGKKAADLIAECPVIKTPRSQGMGLVSKVLIVSAIGAIAGGVYAMVKRQQQ